jgi:hypothetical protein
LLTCYDFNSKSALLKFLFSLLTTSEIGMKFWLKSIGATNHALDNDWLHERYDLVDRIRFATNKRPTGVSIGDRLVLYAAVWERFYGVAIVTSAEPQEDLAEKRWPWVLDVNVPLVVPRLDIAPSLDEMDVAPTSVRQQSHIALTEGQFNKALAALVALVDAP